MIPMPQSTKTGWQERPHLTELNGDPMVRFRYAGRLYHVSPSAVDGLSDDEIAARFTGDPFDVMNRQQMFGNL